MPDLDGGHYFFTGIVPICNDGIVEHEGQKSSPIHMVREALETLPTALQSPAAETVGIQSPFARSTRTHFVRLVVVDQPFFNGRDHADAILSGIRNTDLLASEPADRLTCPYLLVIVDFDPKDASGDGEPRSYFEELWQLMPAELTAIFCYAYGFSAVVDAASFADMMLACQVETTMPFNDYWVGTPSLPSLSKPVLLAIPIAGAILPLLIAAASGRPWWQAAALAILGALIGAALDAAWIVHQGRKQFPSAPGATLRHVLKALYLQQAFTRFAMAQQDLDPAQLGAAFRAFLTEHAPDDLDRPTQPPGVVRSRLAPAAP